MSRVVPFHPQQTITILLATDDLAINSCDINIPTNHHVEFKSCRSQDEILTFVKRHISTLGTLVIPKDIDLKILKEIQKVLTEHNRNLIIPIILIGYINTQALAILKNCRIFYTLDSTRPLLRLPNILNSSLVEFIHVSRLYTHYPDNSVFGTLLKSGSFEFKTLKEAQQLTSYLSSTCPNPRQTALGLSELFINAIEHGNLGITFDEKSTLIENGKWLAEIERRGQLEENKDKKVIVYYKRDHKKITFQITDEGNGFDWKPFYDFSKERLNVSHGRGIAMARETVFSDLRYSPKGNEVYATINLQHIS